MAESPIPVQSPERTDKGNDAIEKCHLMIDSVQAAGNEKHSASQKSKKNHLLEFTGKGLGEGMDTCHGIRPHIKLYTEHSHTISIFSCIIGDCKMKS